MSDKHDFATAVVCAYSMVGTKALAALIEAGVQVLALYTYHQKHDEMWFEPPEVVARRHKIPVFFADNFNSDEVFHHFNKLNPDFLFSFYFREMIEARFLKIPRFGSYNIHGSLLPKYRGRAPINWQILHGEKESGITFHQMTPKPDDGDIIIQEKFLLDWDETALSLIMRIADACDHVVKDAVKKLLGPNSKGIAQSEFGKSTYFGGRKPADGEFDLSWSVSRAFNLIRALADPWPNAFIRVKEPLTLIQPSPQPSPASERGGFNGRAGAGELSSNVANASQQKEDMIIKVCWALPTEEKCEPGQFKFTKNGVLMGMADGALCLHALRKGGVRSERPTEHAKWLRLGNI